MKYQMFSIAMIASVSIASVAQETIRVTNLAPTQEQQIETVTTTRRVVPVAVANNQAISTAAVSENTAVVVQPQYTQQPTTVIEAAPLKTSRAEEMRRVREQSEIETEQKIVEKLEQSRMDAERQRQAAIMGSLNGTAQQVENTNANTNNNTMTVVAPSAAVVMAQPQGQPVVAQPQQPALVQPQQVVIQPQPVAAPAPAAQADGHVVKEVAEVAVTKGIIDDILGDRVSRTYIRGVVGTIDYDSADIRTVGSFGGSLGKAFGDEWNAEITVLNSNAYIQDTYSLYRELHQLDIGLAAQYAFMVGRFRPYVGFLVDYVMREYSDVQYAFGPVPNASSQIESWALDYGFSGGVDLVLNRNFQLGVEYRYMTNLTYEYNQTVMNTPAYQNTPYSAWIPLEERDSSFLGFSIKYVY